MRVELNPNIRSLSGRLGKIVYSTRYDAEGNPKVFARPYVPAKRKTPLSEEEKKNRKLFGLITKEVWRRMQAGDTRQRKEIFAEVRQEMTTH